MNIKSNEHLAGLKCYQEIALDFAQCVVELNENDSPNKQLKRLNEISEAFERYFNIYKNAVEAERELYIYERERLEALNNKP